MEEEEEESGREFVMVLMKVEEEAGSGFLASSISFSTFSSSVSFLKWLFVNCCRLLKIL